MHRSYQPILPCGNKYLQQKWDKAYYDEHRKKVEAAKPMVDTTQPKQQGHLQLKLKKLKLEEERLAVIERENQMLLGKMSSIMRTTGRIDNRNDYESKSLNKEKRQQELLRVVKENRIILQRIASCEPQYSVKKWQEDWNKAEEYMESISRYPHGVKTMSRKKVKPQVKKTKEEKEYTQDNTDDESETTEDVNLSSEEENKDTSD